MTQEVARDQERVERLDLETQRGLDRARAAHALEEADEREAGSERAEQQQGADAARVEERAELAAQRQHCGRGQRGEDAGCRGDEDRIRLIRRELRDRRHEGAVRGAQRGEEESELLAGARHAGTLERRLARADPRTRRGVR